MEESANNGVDLENVRISQSDKITSQIKQLLILRESVKKSDRKIEYLKKHMSNLVESNHSIETNLDKIEQNVSNLNIKISEATKIYIEKKQELKDLESARTNILRKQWSDCSSKIESYANNFSQWITEYSNNVLMRDIEDHQKECKKVTDELTILKEEVDDMREKCDMNCIKANVDVGDIPNLDRTISNIKLNNDKLRHDIRSMEDTANKTQKKLKQCQIVVNEYKKKKTDLF